MSKIKSKQSSKFTHKTFSLNTCVTCLRWKEDRDILINSCCMISRLRKVLLRLRWPCLSLYKTSIFRNFSTKIRKHEWPVFSSLVKWMAFLEQSLNYFVHRAYDYSLIQRKIVDRQGVMNKILLGRKLSLFKAILGVYLLWRKHVNILFLCVCV